MSVRHIVAFVCMGLKVLLENTHDIAAEMKLYFGRSGIPSILDMLLNGDKYRS